MDVFVRTVLLKCVIVRRWKSNTKRKIMSEDSKVENFNEHRLRRAINELSQDEDILKFAQWINKYVTEEFTIETSEENKC